MLVLDERTVYAALPMRDCIEAMANAFATVARGAYVQPLRLIAWQPDRRGGMAAMPGYLDGVLGAKLISVFPQNRAAGLESHQGFVALFDTVDGRLLAIAHAGAITAIRTAAVSALATRLLARPGPQEVALLGSGAQAVTHLQALREVCEVRAVRVWSRTFAHAQRFAGRESRGAVPVVPVETPREALAGASIVCTLTAATAPILESSWIADGAHINSVGASVAGFRELDAETVQRARVYVDMRECAIRESDDLRAISPEQIVGELAEMITGSCPLRQRKPMSRSSSRWAWRSKISPRSRSCTSAR
jgi:ornithine cyclodeaminase